VSCAPTNQTVFTGQNATLQASGGTGSYAWSAPGGSPSSGTGSSFFVSYGSAGSRTVTVTSGTDRSATCIVTVAATPTPTAATPTPPPQAPALNIQKTAQNVTRGGAEGQSATASPGETIQFTITVRSVGSSPAFGVMLRDTLPAGLTYQSGSTTIDGLGGPDGVTGSGLNLGDLAPGRQVIVRFRAVLADATFFPIGTTTLTNVANAQALGVSVSAFTNVTGNAQLLVTRASTGPVTQVPTGPAESAVLALIVSAIVTLLYVGYTATDAFRRHEAKSLAKTAKDDIDSLDFRR
jgi:uncharacterized repeat protein (TIGR01451 family)